MAYIDQAAGQKGLKMVAYSGGEPFLFYQDVRTLMGHASSKGLKGGIVTNCFWAHSDKIVQERLTELMRLGLQEIITSVDDYHLRHVPAHSVAKVIRTALALGIRVGINMLVTTNSAISAKNLADLLSVDQALLGDQTKVWIRESSPVPVGRAKEKLSAGAAKLYGQKELIFNPCFFAVRNAVITPNGSVFACCGFGGATADGPSSITFGGNANEEPLNGIIDQLSRNLLLNLIVHYGPYYLLTLVAQEYPLVRFRKKYVSNCDVCEEISSNIQLRQALAEILMTMAEDARSNVDA
jgi:Zn-finger protein